MWRHDDILDALIDELRDRETDLRCEQAVHGLDALSEVELHPLLAASCARLGLGALREQFYPSTWRKRTWRAGGGEDLPLPRDRERCDLVIVERPGLTLADDVRREKRTRKVRAKTQGTLFEAIAENEIAAGSLAGAESGAARPQDALWLEIKVIGQYEYVDGVPGPNPSYAYRLTRSVTADLAKLAADPIIECGGALLVLFAATKEVVEHDLLALAHRCLDRGIPITSPMTRTLPIQDRIGNRLCALAMFEVRS